MQRLFWADHLVIEAPVLMVGHPDDACAESDVLLLVSKSLLKASRTDVYASCLEGNPCETISFTFEDCSANHTARGSTHNICPSMASGTAVDVDMTHVESTSPV